MDDVERIMRKMDKFIDSLLNMDLYDLEKKELKPLTQIYENEEEIVVVVDLPCISKDKISIKCTEDNLTIKANLDSSFNTRFECYNKTIRLPTKVEPKEARAHFKNGVLQVRLRKKVEGKEIKVE